MLDLDKRVLARPTEITPSSPDMKVVGVFNPGVARGEDATYFLFRVAEAPNEERPGYVGLPRADLNGGIEVDWRRTEDVVIHDSRLVTDRTTGHTRLTNISHLRAAKSRDGVTLDEMSETASLDGRAPFETYGVEDPRITRIGGRFYVTFVSVSPRGVITSLAVTDDFQRFERRGILFPTENKDVVLFPEKINGEYLAIHRPSGGANFGVPEIWLGRSPDLEHWGRHSILITQDSLTSCRRIGAGAPPVRTSEGWLSIYHGSRPSPAHGGASVYFGAGMLHALDAPERLTHLQSASLMEPAETFERNGFFDNVVFPTGAVLRDTRLFIYYGAGDAVSAVAVAELEDVLEYVKQG